MNLLLYELVYFSLCQKKSITINITLIKRFTKISMKTNHGNTFNSLITFEWQKQIQLIVSAFLVIYNTIHNVYK